MAGLSVNGESVPVLVEKCPENGKCLLIVQFLVSFPQPFSVGSGFLIGSSTNVMLDWSDKGSTLQTKKAVSLGDGDVFGSFHKLLPTMG
jgi:hypothetical protein